MLRPSLYGLVTGIPGLGLGKTIFTTDFSLAYPDPALTALALRMMNSLDQFTSARRANAAALLRGLASIPSIETMAPTPGSNPVFLRLPILCRDEATKQHAIAALNTAGIGASGSYPASLLDVPEVRASVVARCEGAGGRRVARDLVTLPTHPFVTGTDIGRVVDTLANVGHMLRPSAAVPSTAVRRSRSS